MTPLQFLMNIFYFKNIYNNKYIYILIRGENLKLYYLFRFVFSQFIYFKINCDFIITIIILILFHCCLFSCLYSRRLKHVVLLFSYLDSKSLLIV